MNFPIHARENSTAEVRKAAGFLGLGVGRCNPGDGAKWRVGPDALTKGVASGSGVVDFHAADAPTLRSKAEVVAYLNGFAAGLDRGLPSHRLRVALSLALDALGGTPGVINARTPGAGEITIAARHLREAFDLIPVHPVVNAAGKGVVE